MTAVEDATISPSLGEELAVDVAEELLHTVHPLVRGYGGQPLHLTLELVAEPLFEGVLHRPHCT